jgi:MoaA/NifB/PqqE/SkfB family radical SAM enzyme
MRCKLLENQIYIGVNGEYRFCCTSMEAPNRETIWTHTPEQWLNSEKVRAAKEQFENNQWPEACIRCQSEESAGVESRRQKKENYGPGISHLDLRLGNSCNLKCISCHSFSSSSINQEAIEMQSKGIIPLHPVIEQNILNWYDEKFFSYFENLPLKEVYLTGGEPMMVKHLPEFLEKLDPSVTIRFTTNATIFNPRVYNILKKFNKVIMSMSIDAVGERIEYIRYGSKWKDIEKNAKIYADFCKVDISPCISVLNAAYFDETKEWADKHNFKIYENLLMWPEYLHVKHAPDSLKAQFKYFDSWKNQTADVHKQKEFIDNITKLDNFRNIKIKDYLPEVAAAYGIS